MIDMAATIVSLEHTLRQLMRLRKGEAFTGDAFRYGRPVITYAQGVNTYPRSCYRCNGGPCRDCG